MFNLISIKGVEYFTIILLSFVLNVFCIIKFIFIQKVIKCNFFLLFILFWCGRCDCWFSTIKNLYFYLQILILKVLLLRDHNINTSFYKHALCNPAYNKSVSSIFVSIQKATNILNLLTNPICEIYIFHFSYLIVNSFFIGK